MNFIDHSYVFNKLPLSDEAKEKLHHELQRQCSELKEDGTGDEPQDAGTETLALPSEAAEGVIDTASTTSPTYPASDR